MRARRVDIADKAAFQALFAVHDTAHRHEFPGGPFWLEHEVRAFYEGDAVHDTTLWVAEDLGEVLGTGVLDVPLKDNLTLGEVDVAVRPDARRRGVGSSLLRAVEQAAREDGRSRLVARLNGPLGPTSTPGMAFAEHHGYSRRLVAIIRVVRPPFDLSRLAEVEREARSHAEGYEIVTWRDRVPTEHVLESARLIGRMSIDAPLGNLDYEAEQWDVGRIRTREEQLVRMRRDVWCAVALAPGGTMAGQTEIVVARESDANAFQDETIVDPRHRGHRLGLLLKIANLRSLLRDRPHIRSIWTWNAESNSFMISVNEKLGYVPEGCSVSYQRDL